MSRSQPIADVAPRFAALLELVNFGADGEDLFLLCFSAPPDVAELLPLLDGQGGFRAGKPFMQGEVSDGKAEFEITIAPEMSIELLHIIIPAVALHVTFRGHKGTL